jgi:hypothetical protein
LQWVCQQTAMAGKGFSVWAGLYLRCSSVGGGDPGWGLLTPGHCPQECVAHWIRSRKGNAQHDPRLLLHNLCLFGNCQGVDILDESIGHILELLQAAPLFVFREIIGLNETLEVTPDIAD